jgi:hypothetical protein
MLMLMWHRLKDAYSLAERGYQGGVVRETAQTLAAVTAMLSLADKDQGD